MVAPSDREENPLKITSVSYGRTKSFSNEYGNIRISANADVGTDQSPEDALKELEQFVDGEVAQRISLRESLADQRCELDNLRWRHQDIQDQIQRKQRVLKQLLALLEKHGVDLPDIEHAQELAGYDPFCEDTGEDEESDNGDSS